jgi:flagellar biosynthesis protein FlhF
MRVKIYRARSMDAAMLQIRAETGPDALILSNRRVAGGVEVTIGVEAADEYVPAPERQACLRYHNVPDSLAHKLGAGALAFALSAAFRFRAFDLATGSRPILLAGPPGAGKTLTAARLATRLVLGGVRPLVLTADTSRAGGVEQLAAFTRLLGLHLLPATHLPALRIALAERPDHAPVLIDSAGFDPFDATQRDMIAALAASANAIIALVLPAGLDASEAGEMAAAGMEAGATHLVVTRIDLSRRLGAVIAAAGSGLSLAEAGIGSGAADGLVTMTPGFLADRLGQFSTK